MKIFFIGFIVLFSFESFSQSVTRKTIGLTFLFTHENTGLPDIGDLTFQLLNGNADLQLQAGYNFGIDTSTGGHIEYNGKTHTLSFKGRGPSQLDFNVVVDSNIATLMFSIKGDNRSTGKVKIIGKEPVVWAYPDNDGHYLLPLN